MQVNIAGQLGLN